MKPVIHESAFVAENATVRGSVTIGPEAGIYFGAVLRAETAPITVGEGANIQDNCIVHADPGFPAVIGRDCTVGHAAILHGCTIGDNTLVGMGAIVLNGAVVGRDCIVAAGALVTQGAVIPDGLHGHGCARQGPPPPDAGGDRPERRLRRRIPPGVPAV